LIRRMSRACSKTNEAGGCPKNCAPFHVSLPDCTSLGASPAFGC
jgi:hypothetical protein